MGRELHRQVKGQVHVPWRDRELVRKAREIEEEVRLAALQADGAMALAGHIMEGLLVLDNYRADLAKGDQAHNALLAEIEATAIQQVKQIQRNLNNPWDL